MLKRTSLPRVLKKKQHSQVKSINFLGSDDGITWVAEKRSSTFHCHQYPGKGQVLPKKVRIRVTYELANDGFITVHRVYLLQEDQTSVCFFNRSAEQIGEKESRIQKYLQGNRLIKVFIYLTDERLDGIIDAIHQAEDSEAVRSLTRIGPEAFPLRKVE